MASKPKRHSMEEALKERDEVRAFLDEGRANRKSENSDTSPKPSQKSPTRRIAVTLRLPEEIAHALIDASAKRRKNRETISPSERNNKNLLLLIADEFQDLVTATEDGISDHKTVDRIRSAGACIIAGMQSEISADPAISEKKRKVLSLNMRSRLIFRAADMEGATLSADFIGKKRIWKKTISSKPGSLNRTISRRQEQEHYVHPTQLARLPDHTAYAVHPSKRYTRKRIAPLDGEGRVFPWSH